MDLALAPILEIASGDTVSLQLPLAATPLCTRLGGHRPHVDAFDYKLASPVAASARDSSSALSSKASEPAAATTGSKEPGPSKKGPSGDGGGGAQTRAAWGS